MTKISKENILHLGILGAARIVPRAIITPAKQVPEVSVTAIAARDPERAHQFARKHTIPTVHESYDALLADPSLDAIYNPLPNSHHCEWAIRALQAGKHVLCEKPFAANAAEATRMADTAVETGLVLAEAFHHLDHPLAQRMKAIIDSGQLGTIRHVEAHFCIPCFRPGDIRFRYDLAGGAIMDVGCYAIRLLRFLTGLEPTVQRASARCSSSQVDRWMDADLHFAANSENSNIPGPDGITGRLTCSLASIVVLRMSARVQGDTGEMRVINPFVPHAFNRLTVRSAQGNTSERVTGDTTYTHQLRAFVKAVRGTGTMQSDAQDAIANMRVIDAVYEKAGLKLRGSDQSK